jgi:hypothetical protein
MKNKISEYELIIDNYQHEIETNVKKKNHELVELEEAYKEKVRKCQAWEKVFIKNIYTLFLCNIFILYIIIY